MTERWEGRDTTHPSDVLRAGRPHFDSSSLRSRLQKPVLEAPGEADSLCSFCFADHCAVSSSLPPSSPHAAKLPPARQPCRPEVPGYKTWRGILCLPMPHARTPGHLPGHPISLPRSSTGSTVSPVMLESIRPEAASTCLASV